MSAYVSSWITFDDGMYWVHSIMGAAIPFLDFDVAQICALKLAGGE